MKTLIFTGFSDDIFGEIHSFNDDFDNCASGEAIEYLVSNGDGAIVVTGQYCPNHSGSWLIGVANYDLDDEKLPDWKMSIDPDPKRNYNPRLIIEAPDDVTIRCLQKG